MTAPRLTIPNPGAIDRATPEQRQEWDYMMERRRQLMEDISTRIQMRQALAPDQVDVVQSHANVQQGGLGGQMLPPNPMERNELIGAARYYGDIPNPESLPDNVLKQYVEARRLKARQATAAEKRAEGTDPSLFGMKEGLATLGVGALEGLFGLARRIPFLGDVYGRLENTQRAEQSLGALNEAALGGISADVRDGIGFVKGAGALVGTAAPYGAAWKVAGAIGEVPFISNVLGRASMPIGRGALSIAKGLGLGVAGQRAAVQAAWQVAGAAAQGAGMGLLTETGGDAPITERIKNVARDAGFTAGVTALAAAIPAVAARARRAFGADTFVGDAGVGIPRSSGPAQNPNEVVGEYQIISGDLPSGTPQGLLPPGPRLLPSGPRALPPGEPPVAPAPTAYTPPPRNQVYRPDGNGGYVLDNTPPFKASGYLQIQDQLRSGVAVEPRLVQQKVAEVQQELATYGYTPEQIQNFALAPQTAYLHHQDRTQFLAEAQAYLTKVRPEGRQAYVGAGRLRYDAGRQPATQGERLNSPMEHEAALYRVNKMLRDYVYGQTVTPTDPEALFGDGGPLRNSAPVKTTEAPQVAAALTHEATIVESPAVDDIASHSELNHATVAQAALASRPGQISVIQGVGDVGKTVRQLVQAQQTGRVMPHQFRVVQQRVMQPAPGQAEVPERIAAAAVVRHDTGEILTGRTHFMARGDYFHPDAQEGFITNQGRYLTREEAAQFVETTDPIAAQLVKDRVEYSKRVNEMYGGVEIRTLKPFLDANDLTNKGVAPISTVRHDILVSDGLPITNKRVDQYQKYGMFEGQLATTADGREVVIAGVSGDGVNVRPVFGKNLGEVLPHDAVLPGKATMASGEHIGVRRASDAYHSFKEYSQGQMVKEAAQAGIPIPQWLERETATQLPRLMEDWFKAQKITAPGEKAALEVYFNQQRTQEIAALGGEELAHAHTEIRTAIAEQRANPTPPLPVEDVAATKGFTYEFDPQTGGGTLVDQLSDLRVPVESSEAAHEFLRSYNRELPDYTPASEFPIEVAQGVPGDDVGNPNEPVDNQSNEMRASLARRAATELARASGEFARSVGVGGPPAYGTGGPPAPPPPVAPVPRDYPPYDPQRALPAGTTRRERAGDWFQALSKTDLPKWSEADRFFDSNIVQYMNTTSAWMRRLDEHLHKLGYEDVNVYAMFQKFEAGLYAAHNEAQDWFKRSAAIKVMFRRYFKRKGVVAEVAEIADPNARMAAMDRLGFTEREKTGMRLIEQLFDDLANTAGIGRRILSGYIPHVRMRQARGESQPYDDLEALSYLPNAEFFAEHAREGNMQMRQLDIGLLMDTWIRAWTFHKHVGPTWDLFKSEWANDPRVPVKIRDAVMDYLSTARMGYQAQHDAFIHGTHHLLRKMGVPVTYGEVANFWGGVSGTMFRSFIGGRPSAIFRDSIQPWLGWTKLGGTSTAEAYTKWVKGGAARDEMYDRALKGGWAEKEMVAHANVEFLSQPQLNDEGVSLLSQEMADRREAWAQYGDLIHDAMPESMRKGMAGSKYDPGFWYSRLAVMNRVVSGEAGWIPASKALAEYSFERGKLYRADATRAYIGPEGAARVEERIGQLHAKLLDKLMVDSRAIVHSGPVQREFQRLVANEDYEEAANLLAREAANSQFRGGQREQPLKVRRAGVAGRFGMQFGNFSISYVNWMADTFGNSYTPIAERAKIAARMATITALLVGAGAVTGWKTGGLLWSSALGFFMNGSPLVSWARRAQEQGWGKALSGIPAGLATSLNPYQGYINTARGYAEALTQDNPIESALRVTTTGQVQDAPGAARWLQTFGGTPSGAVNAPVAAGGTPAGVPSLWEAMRGAAQGNQQMRQQFSPEELSILDSMRNAPDTAKWKAVMGYRQRAQSQPVSTAPVGSGARQ